MTDVPMTYFDFRAWRRRQKFASPQIANKAKLVENDLHMLSGPAGKIPRIRELAAQNVAEFAAMLKAG